MHETGPESEIDTAAFARRGATEDWTEDFFEIHLSSVPSNDYSVTEKLSTVIKQIFLFPTRTTAICGAIALAWLLYCITMVTFGLGSLSNCDAEPKLPRLVTIHGLIWVLLSGYTIFRLMWIEVSATGLPECSFTVGHPAKRLNWKKEFTYGVDAALLFIIVVIFICQMVVYIRVRASDARIVSISTSSKSYNTTLCGMHMNCCEKSLVRFTVYQLVMSYVAQMVLAGTYLYLFGLLNKIRDRICCCRFAVAEGEANRLV